MFGCSQSTVSGHLGSARMHGAYTRVCLGHAPALLISRASGESIARFDDATRALSNHSSVVDLAAVHWMLFLVSSLEVQFTEPQQHIQRRRVQKYATLTSIDLAYLMLQHSLQHEVKQEDTQRCTAFERAPPAI